MFILLCFVCFIRFLQLWDTAVPTRGETTVQFSAMRVERARRRS